MDVSFLTEYINPIILGVCLLVGYCLKTAFENFPNRFIPLTALCLGCAIAVCMHFHDGITVEVILGGMISGLASTGLYEMLRNLLNSNSNNSEG